MTPVQAGLQMSIASNQDHTFLMSSTDLNGTKLNTGTWSTNGNNLTLTNAANVIQTYSFSEVGSILSINNFKYMHPTLGLVLLKLEFTIQ